MPPHRPVAALHLKRELRQASKDSERPNQNTRLAKRKHAGRCGPPVGDDIGGGQQCGLHGVLVKTGKYREDYAGRATVTPTTSSTRSPTCQTCWRMAEDGRSLRRAKGLQATRLLQ